MNTKIEMERRKLIGISEIKGFFPQKASLGIISIRSGDFEKEWGALSISEWFIEIERIDQSEGPLSKRADIRKSPAYNTTYMD
jgi:hypothetical protein